jgi:DNA-binding NtrC family response regulator
MTRNALPVALVVDDDADFARTVRLFAEDLGYLTLHADCVGKAREQIAHGGIDFILLDLGLPDGSGLDLLDEIDLGHAQVVVATGHPTVESAIRAVHLPVLEYLVKPLDLGQLAALLEHTRARVSQEPAPASADDFGLIGSSAAMRELRRLIARVAKVDASVFIVGESGTGKELVARAIHERSGRSGPFVALNCGAVNAELLASQLFGHERGSFTGASHRYRGLLEQANGGTLFLDEITEMPASLQVYLLRVLETQRVTRVGGSEEIQLDTRVLAASNRPTDVAVAEGRLRVDLFYRLADVPLYLAPLRERGEDVIVLAHAFLARLNERYQRRARLSDAACRTLLRHDWPGNVRELRSAVQRGFLMSSGDEIRVEPMRLRHGANHATGHVVFHPGMSYTEMQRQMLIATLQHFGGDKTQAANALGVSVRTIYNQLAELRRGTDGEPDGSQSARFQGGPSAGHPEPGRRVHG